MTSGMSQRINMLFAQPPPDTGPGARIHYLSVLLMLQVAEICYWTAYRSGPRHACSRIPSAALTAVPVELTMRIRLTDRFFFGLPFRLRCVLQSLHRGHLVPCTLPAATEYCALLSLPHRATHSGDGQCVQRLIPQEFD